MTPATTPVPAAAPRLPPRRARFVLEYLKDLNATQAAIRAGYAPRGASTEGARLLVNAEVQAAVQAQQARHAHLAEVDGEAALRRQEERGRALLTDVMVWDEDGAIQLRPSAVLTEAQARGVKSIQVHETETTEEKGGEVVRRTIRRRVKVEQHDAKGADDTVLRATGRLSGEPGDVGGHVQKVFLLPVVALNAGAWQEAVAERRALPPGPQVGE
jgi:phage terminase small subunit